MVGDAPAGPTIVVMAGAEHWDEVWTARADGEMSWWQPDAEP
jgi:hypothetical protein